MKFIMEPTQENIERLAEKLESVAKKMTMRDLEGASEKFKDYFEIAKQLMEQYPNLNIEEIGKIYEEQCQAQIKEADNMEH